MTRNGFVSVIIPAYNAAWCVSRAVDSALAQTYQNLEVIVVNDDSTDETPAVLARYGAAVRVINKPNGGLPSARNAGIQAAGGEFVAFLDADDWWLPEKLACQMELLRSRPELGFCSTAARVETPEGKTLNIWTCPAPASTILETIFQTNAAVAGSGSAVLVRRALFERAGFFDETLRSLEDVDMWMRLAAIAEYGCVKEPLVVILKREGSISRDLTQMRESAIKVMCKNRNLLPGNRQGSFWRAAYAGMLTDYAKWEYREGFRRSALARAAQALAFAPLERGRLALSLLRDMVLGRPL